MFCRKMTVQGRRAWWEWLFRNKNARSFFKARKAVPQNDSCTLYIEGSSVFSENVTSECLSRVCMVYWRQGCQSNKRCCVHLFVTPFEEIPEKAALTLEKVAHYETHSKTYCKLKFEIGLGHLFLNSTWRLLKQETFWILRLEPSFEKNGWRSWA